MNQSVTNGIRVEKGPHVYHQRDPHPATYANVPQVVLVSY